MKKAFVVVALLLVAPPVFAQSDPHRAAVYMPSCAAAADIAQGRRPAADSPDAAKQLNQAALCFNALMAVQNLAPLLKPELAMCPPADAKPAQTIQTIIAYLKKHPEKLNDNFHRVAVSALAEAWPCAK